MGKSSLWQIPHNHFKSLYNARTLRADYRAWLLQVGVPCLVGTGVGVAGGELEKVGDAVAGVAIVSGLLFSMAVLLFQLRMSLVGDKRLTQKDYELVDECMANTLWAIVWGLSLTVYLVVVGALDGMSGSAWAPLLTGIAAGAAVHFLLVIMMCIKRLQRSYERFAAKRA